MKDIVCEHCVNLKNDWCEKIIDSPDKFRKRDCQYYRMKTNADKIRNMSNEELAEFLIEVEYGYKKITVCRKECDECMNDIKTCVLLCEMWLEKEV